MFIRYTTLGALDFQNLHYLVVFNTTGNGITPYSAPGLQQYANYSFVIVFGGSTAGAAYAVYYVINTGTATDQFQLQQLVYNPAYVTNFNNNSNPSQGNQFTFTFNRLLLTAPTPTNPTPNPSPTPAGIPTLANGVSSLWAINCFTADTNNGVIDVISPVNGVNDTTFNSFVINTLSPFDLTSTKPNPPPVQVTNQRAQLMAVEIANVP